ncbi:MAG: hypothetical protein GX856_06860 [Gammaproteobacteria bacterium]|nr:hypothetical protein [Gammaproteobacteria bacterium]
MGPPPAEKRRRANKDTFAEGVVTVPADAEADAPELPGWESYSTETLRWYNTWCRSPQAALFTVTDWQRLHMLAPLVQEYFAKPSTKLMAEIRLSESLLGATHLDRLRGRIKVEPRKPASGTLAGVADMNQARRKRMTDAS